MVTEAVRRNARVAWFLTYAQADQLQAIRAGRPFPGTPRSRRVMLARGLAVEGEGGTLALTPAGTAAEILTRLLGLPGHPNQSTQSTDPGSPG